MDLRVLVLRCSICEGTCRKFSRNETGKVQPTVSDSFEKSADFGKHVAVMVNPPAVSKNPFALLDDDDDSPVTAASERKKEVKKRAPNPAPKRDAPPPIFTDETEIEFWKGRRFHDSSKKPTAGDGIIRHHRHESRLRHVSPKSCRLCGQPKNEDSMMYHMKQLCNQLTETIRQPPASVHQFYTRCVGAIFLYSSQQDRTIRMLTALQNRRLDENKQDKDHESNWALMHGCVQGKVNLVKDKVSNAYSASECFCGALFRKIAEKTGIDMEECVYELARKHAVQEVDIVRPLVVNTAFESAFFVFHCSEHFIQALRESVAQLIAKENVFTDWTLFKKAEAEFKNSRVRSGQTGGRFESSPSFAKVTGTASIPWKNFVDFFSTYPTITSISHFGRSVPGINQEDEVGVYKLLLEALAKLNQPVGVILSGGAAGNHATDATACPQVCSDESEKGGA